MAEGASPLDLVVRILNNQLTSLLWIDEKVSCLLNIHGTKFWIATQQICFSCQTNTLSWCYTGGRAVWTHSNFCRPGSIRQRPQGFSTSWGLTEQCFHFIPPQLIDGPCHVTVSGACCIFVRWFKHIQEMARTEDHCSLLHCNRPKTWRCSGSYYL